MSFGLNRRRRETALELPKYQLLKSLVVGVGVFFAALGMGEAVYRIAFFQFEGATDRLPIEALFGIIFATFIARHLLQRDSRNIAAQRALEAIRKRNEKIGVALGAITPPPFPVEHQAIRIIREQVDFIRWKLTDTLAE